MDSSSIPFRSHTALLLAAALPYLQPSYRHPVELALKFLEFSETIKLYREFHTQDAGFPGNYPKDADQPVKGSGLFGLINHVVLDLEGMLSSLTKVCTGNEKEIIGMLLNLIRAKNFYENYGDVLKTFMSSAMPSESADTPEVPIPGSSFSTTPAPGDFSMPDMASLFAGGDLTSMLNEEQSETLNLLKSLFESE